MQTHNLIFLTSNEHKIKEVRKIIPNIKHLAVDVKEIRSDDFKEVAKFKILDALSREELDLKEDDVVFVEDAGLEILSLKRFPGTYSKWVFEKIGNEGILNLMRNHENREARFICVVAAYFSKTKEFVFVEGEVRGKISTEIKGSGWGYDPIFIPLGYDVTFGEAPDLKNKLSHRYLAWSKMKEMLIEKGYLKG